MMNRRHEGQGALIKHYARRMSAEQRVAKLTQVSCADTLTSAVNLSLDLVLYDLAQASFRPLVRLTPAPFEQKLGAGTGAPRKQGSPNQDQQRVSRVVRTT
jgi:hypothetical protein